MKQIQIWACVAVLLLAGFPAGRVTWACGTCGCGGGGDEAQALPTTQVKDYVSGQVFVPSAETLTSSYQEVAFFFSAAESKAAFDADGAKYFTMASNDFRFYYAQILNHYFAIQAQLAADKVDGVTDSAQHIMQLAEFVMRLQPTFDEKQMTEYVRVAQAVYGAVMPLCLPIDLEHARAAFWPLSQAMIDYAKGFNDAPDGAVCREFKCPMARENQGASWLQPGETVHNPYLGSKMPDCGSLTTDYTPFCIVMQSKGEEECIDPSVVTIYEGRSFHFCCKKCIRQFEKDPAAFLATK